MIACRVTIRWSGQQGFALFVVSAGAAGQLAAGHLRHWIAGIMALQFRTFLAATALSLMPSLPIAQGVSGESFDVNVIVTANGADVFSAWDRGQPGFSVVPVGNARRGQFLSTVVLFRGCQPDSAGNCNAEMDITVYDPNGREYGAMTKVELWKAKPAPSVGATQLSRDYMGIVIEAKDLAGTYRVVVLARDLISKREAKAETTFTVK